ncbi:unnamed protein product [Aspergillus oryzae var. brunneus]|uniref:Unnamed protein product n=1 Tax=Aspergillus oryzae var. brunneus TaxID=332754 RepID=A0ABQ6L886_ASPOZ|nr:unnamed protein product [Aspergillus oryzae var. brunneus]
MINIKIMNKNPPHESWQLVSIPCHCLAAIFFIVLAKARMPVDQKGTDSVKGSLSDAPVGMDRRDKRTVQGLLRLVTRITPTIHCDYQEHTLGHLSGPMAGSYSPMSRVVTLKGVHPLKLTETLVAGKFFTAFNNKIKILGISPLHREDGVKILDLLCLM